MIAWSFDSNINLELVLAALPPEDWDLTPALAAVEEELRTPADPVITIKRVAVLFHTESALLKLIQILGEEMLGKNGGQLCL